MTSRATSATVQQGAAGKRRVPRARASKIFIGIHLCFVLLPIVVIAVWAFADRWAWPDLAPQQFSLRGFTEVFLGSQATGVAVMLQSIGIALACAALTTVVAGLAARAVCCHSWRGRNVLYFSLMAPFLIPTTVFAMGVQVLFIQMGLARTTFGVILAHAIVALPYAATIMIDVTRAVGVRLEEAAHVLGARPLSTFLHVTLPSLLPGVLSSLSMCYIMSFSQYFLTLLIGGGAVRTFATAMFPYLSGGDRTIAAAYGLAFIVVTFLVFLLFEWLLKRFGFRESGTLFGS